MPVSAAYPTPLTPQQLRARAGRVCVALSGPDMLQVAAEAVGQHRFLELRLDSLPDPASLLPGLQAFLHTHPEVTAVSTCRRTSFGGAFQGTAQEQAAILQASVEAGCLLVDAEVETAEELGPDVLATMRKAGAAVILSWHDFAGTPDLLPVLRRLQSFQPDFLKIVPTAQTLNDSLLLIDLLEQHGADGNLVAMSMGLKGVLTRVLGPRFGSAFTFAAPDGGGGTAPGQVSASTLRDLYRVESISLETEIYGVAGTPIGASLSPLMHNTALKQAGRDAVYLPLETGDAQELLQVAERLKLRGLSITMPLKETVLPLLTTSDPEVVTMGACNTILREADGTLHGFNTDVAGIVGPLETRCSLLGKRVLVLGAGGAARAAVFGLTARGAEVYLLNRTRERAEALAQESGASVLRQEALTGTRFDIIINSTPYGMRGREMDAPIPPAEMRCDLFFDLVYNPLQTPLMKVAEDRGIQTIPGAAMFVAQGVRQFELWTGLKAPEEAMLRVVTEALGAA
ncbi:MAG: shikimate dehydrogenase [Janthinobacterium lividum]